MDNTRRVGDRHARRGKDCYGVAHCKDDDRVKLRDYTWGDKDRKRHCRRCKVRGLRYGSKTGFCVVCWSRLPAIIKATSANFELAAVIARYKTSMVEQFGIEAAAKLLAVDPAELDPTRYKP